MKPENDVPRTSGQILNITSNTSYQVDGLARIQGKYSPASVLLITIIGIAVAEIIAMLVIYFFRYLPYSQQVLLDTVIMTVIIFPLLYFLSFRPLLQHIQQRYQVERIIQTRLRLIQFANMHSLSELLQFTLDEIESLTGSAMGYFQILEADQNNISLQAWSTNTVKNMHSIISTDVHNAVNQAGVWADCVRQRRPVIHNNYESLPASRRKGMPDGHAPIVREMAVPIIRDEKIVAVLGVGNKSKDYTTSDIDLVSTLADFAWDIVRHKQAGDDLRQSEEKFRTLVDWTYDWENWIDPQENIVYTSPACERITGYSPEEFINDPDLLIQIVHPDDRDSYKEHHLIVHDETAGVSGIEYRIIGKNGEEHWIEHICRPLFGRDNRYLGRRISNRDITERKQTEMEIRERNQKEKILTQTIHTMQLDIARDLHDTVGQNISFLRLKLDFLAGNKSMKKSDMQVEIQSMTKAANESYDLLRGTLAVLQSGNNSADLFRVFSRYAEQIQERAALKVDFSTLGEARPLSAKRMRQLFFVFREALSNIEKHAHATHVSVQINWYHEYLLFTVLDDGNGFDPSMIEYTSHYGLKFMRDRVEMLNGSMDIQSTIGAGTTLMIQVPYE
jgi:PAS domain S-box-containing protein